MMLSSSLKQKPKYSQSFRGARYFILKKISLVRR